MNAQHSYWQIEELRWRLEQLVRDLADTMLALETRVEEHVVAANPSFTLTDVSMPAEFI